MHAEKGMLARRGWHWGNLSADNQEEHMLWYTWQGQTYDFLEQRRFRELFYEFGVHPDAAFGWDARLAGLCTAARVLRCMLRGP